MIFSLEAIEAQHGDSFILHFGSNGHPRFMLIDGGPYTVYRDRLKPRLEQIRKKWGAGEDRVLTLEMLMVSHIDDDHIGGVLALADEMAECRTAREVEHYKIATLWFNSFSDVVGNAAREIFTNIPASAGVADIEAGFPGLKVDRETAAVIASVSQGRQLRDQARLLNIPLNAPFDGMVMTPEEGIKSFVWGDSGLRLTVLAPNERRLKKLSAKWDAAVKKHKNGQTGALMAAYTDQSPYNLSSIVVLIELGGKRILLTGDARGDHIVEGLMKARLLKNEDDTLHIDVLKLPHHGSDRDVESKFFHQITANHYIISASGKYDNPDMDVLRWISQARRDDEYQVHLTNRDGECELKDKLRKLMVSDKVLAKHLRFREECVVSIKLDLGSSVTY
jgi:beta-lactamase superfamily II metal-dependent hydrolase